ncbi:binding-protein-dependent transport systems inner membrane component [Paenibacillus algicola]|uniref:Binding-protein-dependent transport systems inner membrane component n=1 Tax=Paenibacillus algicola TaxID=2565926 RepID=A0A4P8XP35_9BACL|nr:hypothetical protein [Paenibacillus algicola]QCT04388.1 binding-protein-dependent transport systems inner membrane component [Paenibacillus algicola]
MGKIVELILSNAQFLASGELSSYSSEMVTTASIGTVNMAIAVIGMLPMLVAYPFF